MASIFITGATGLIGSHLCKHFIDAGHAVVALKRENSNLGLLYDYAEQIEWKLGDITDPKSLEGIFSTIDYVIHSAAMISFEEDNQQTMIQVNVNGTMNVLKEAKESNVQKFCLISSSAALGKPLKGQLIDENINTETSIKNTHYARSKYLAEQATWSAGKSGLPILILNPPVVLGAGDWTQSSGRLIDYVWKRKSFYPSGIVNVVDLRDLVHMLDQLLFSDVTNEQFIVSGHSIYYKEFFEKTALKMNCTPPKLKLSKFFAEVLWRLEKARSKLTGSKPFITKETARSSSSEYRYSNYKILKSTNLEFRALEDTIDYVCQAYLNDLQIGKKIKHK